jgi:hypothetical protein
MIFLAISTPSVLTCKCLAKCHLFFTVTHTVFAPLSAPIPISTWGCFQFSNNKVPFLVEYNLPYLVFSVSLTTLVPHWTSWYMVYLKPTYTCIVGIAIVSIYNVFQSSTVFWKECNNFSDFSRNMSYYCTVL